LTNNIFSITFLILKEKLFDANNSQHTHTDTDTKAHTYRKYKRKTPRPISKAENCELSASPYAGNNDLLFSLDGKVWQQEKMCV
jgi:hypothetical protein